MTFEERIRLIVSLDDLVQRKFKGNAVEYARKLGVSRSAFFRILDYTRNELRAPVVYNKPENRYEYQADGKILFGFSSPELLQTESAKMLKGGTGAYLSNTRLENLFSSPTSRDLSVLCLIQGFETEPSSNLTINKNL